MVVGDLAESTEVAVLGAGPGGYVAAIRLAQLGKEVTLISKEKIPGGECLLRGCIPSKALIEAAHFFSKLQGAKDFGIEVEGTKLHVSTLQKWKEGIIQRLGKGVQQLLKQNGVKWVEGKAHLLDEHCLEIQTAHALQQLRFDNLIIATGGQPRPLKGFDFDGETILSSDHALSLKEIPSSLLVIGGGYIGLELGETYAKFGSRVTVVEALDDILLGVDPALLRPLKKKLSELKIELRVQTLAKSVSLNAKGAKVLLEARDHSTQELQIQKILVAVGRLPQSGKLGLENTGIQIDAKGFIPINAQCQTMVPHIYAIGDVAGGMMLAHKASREGIVAASSIAGQADAFDNQVPAVIFTDPEIAYVGLSEAEALERGIEVVTGMFGFAANGRAMTLNETEGLVKVVAEKSTGRVLGVQMAGPHVSDLISEATLGIEMGASLEDFDLTIHPHPTLSEAVHEAMESALGMSIHRYQRVARKD